MPNAKMTGPTSRAKTSEAIPAGPPGCKGQLAVKSHTAGGRQESKNPIAITSPPISSFSRTVRAGIKHLRGLPAIRVSSAAARLGQTPPRLTDHQKCPERTSNHQNEYGPRIESSQKASSFHTKSTSCS